MHVAKAAVYGEATGSGTYPIFFFCLQLGGRTASGAAQAAFGGRGLGDMQVHKSKLQKDLEAATASGAAAQPRRAPLGRCDSSVSRNTSISGIAIFRCRKQF